MRGGEMPVRHNLALAAAPMLPSRAAAAFRRNLCPEFWPVDASSSISSRQGPAAIAQSALRSLRLDVRIQSIPYYYRHIYQPHAGTVWNGFGHSYGS